MGVQHRPRPDADAIVVIDNRDLRPGSTPPPIVAKPGRRNMQAAGVARDRPVRSIDRQVLRETSALWSASHLDMSEYITEQHGYGITAAAAGDQVEDLAATMLASTLGLEFDPDAAWNERKQVYEHSSLIIDSKSITAVAECGPDNRSTCAIAAAAFCFRSALRVARALRTSF